MGRLYLAWRCRRENHSKWLDKLSLVMLVNVLVNASKPHINITKNSIRENKNIAGWRRGKQPWWV